MTRLTRYCKIDTTELTEQNKQLASMLPDYDYARNESGFATSNTQQCIDKLGQLEDIEDELGIDLITLFKALKDGIWIKKTNGFDELFYHEGVGSFSLCFKEIYVEHECEYQYPYALKDYGKTWALTKEELL